MTQFYSEFKQDLINARIMKFVFRYIGDLEDKTIEQRERDSYFDNDSADPVFDVLYGMFLPPNASIEDFKAFRKQIGPKLLQVMNALGRAAIDKYTKQKGFKDVRELYKKHKDIIEKYYLCLDSSLPETQNKDNPLDINRHIRNKFLHWNEKDFKDTTDNKRPFRINKTGEEILFQRVLIHLERQGNDTQVTTFFYDKGNEERRIRVHEPFSIPNINFPMPQAKLNVYYAEFILWLLDLIVREIDSAL